MSKVPPVELRYGGGKVLELLNDHDAVPESSFGRSLATDERSEEINSRAFLDLRLGPSRVVQQRHYGSEQAFLPHRCSAATLHGSSPQDCPYSVDTQARRRRSRFLASRQPGVSLRHNQCRVPRTGRTMRRRTFMAALLGGFAAVAGSASRASSPVGSSPQSKRTRSSRRPARRFWHRRYQRIHLEGIRRLERAR